MAQPCEHSDVRPRRTSDEFLSRVIVRYSNMADYSSVVDKRLNTGMAPTCDWMIKIVKVHKLYLNSLHVSIVNRVYRSGTMKYRCENTDVSNKKWPLT